MSFFTDVIQKDARYTSITAIRDMDLLEPVTRAAVNSILKDAEALGVILMVTETYRSKERQQHLFSIGVTKLQLVGVHHYGLACDFCKLENGQPSWAGDWRFLGTLASKYGFIWGGDWGEPNKTHTFLDRDHIQRVTLAQQEALFAGTWYPAEQTT